MEKKENNLLIVFISIIFILYGSKSQSPASESITNENEGIITSSKTDSNGLNLPDYAEEVLRVFPEWEVIQCDAKPSLKIDGYEGYRLVLRQSWKDYIRTAQQQIELNPSADDNSRFVTKYNYIDLVLFKNDKTLPDNIIKKIPWLKLEQEYFTKPVYMGKGQGFDWFANITLYFQEILRKALNLEGGDNRIQLLMEGLYIKDKGGMTANSVPFLLSEFGDKAVESIERAVQTHNEEDSWSAIFALHTIQSNKSAELLKKYYFSKNSAISNAAAYSLICKPFKIQAKKEYFDMLSKQKYIREIGKACIEFNWKDAFPIFEDICSKPKDWRNYYDAFILKRSLEGRPVPEELINAQEIIWSSAFSTEKKDTEAATQAKQKIIESPDKEAAVAIAINIVNFTTKGNSNTINQVRDIGWEILKTLPKTETTKLYKILDRSLESGQDRDLLKKFQEIIN